ncbi:MAG: hypothetical protein IJ165_11115 [Proteobacteria bacterium]|nr:hypothetical protein [Pseudomonadota bacterium]
MNTVRAQSTTLCETFDRDGFLAMLKKRDLEAICDHLDDYVETGWINPIEAGNKRRFHRGHMLILLRILSCTDIKYQSALQKNYDFEDIMSRRAYICDLETENVREDAKIINQLFLWLWCNDASAFNVMNAVHTKAVIDISLDRLDPTGVYEGLKRDDIGTCKLVHDLITMQDEISSIIALASSLGISIPNVPHIFDRKRRLDEIQSLLLPPSSPFLAVPTRDINADDRMKFIKTRNKLLVEKDYKGLVEHYDAHSHLFTCEPLRHAQMCVCLGHIYSDLLNDKAKAAEEFKEALEYDNGNKAAFQEIDRSLRALEKWPELVELLYNYWDSIEDPQKRCAMILDCAQLQAFKCQNIEEAIRLYERCMLEGYPGNDFDNLYKIIAGLMDNNTDLERMRALVTLSLHIVNYSQCDKVMSLRQKFDTSTEPLGSCLSLLIEAGVQSFKGDQPQALETLRDAIVQYPSIDLMEGLLYRIATKLQSFNEFRESINDLDSEALSNADLSDVWMRISKVLLRLPKYDLLALEYAEKASAADPTNNKAIDLCYELSVNASQPERAYIYGSVKAARTQDDDERANLENAIKDYRLAIGNDEGKLLTIYETLLQFGDLNDVVIDGIRDLISSVDDMKAIATLQRVEAKCMAVGMSSFVEELYQSVLERDISLELRKSLLERYLGFLLGQGTNLKLDVFIATHAQLYCLAPSELRLTMFKSTVQDNLDAFRTWTNYLEDGIANIEDRKTVAKIQTTLANCYQNILHDQDKAAEAYANLLKTAPDNVPAFKCSFSAFERLERYYECIEVAKSFPLDKLSPQERFSYAFKSLTYAFIHLFDTDAIRFFFNLIANDDENMVPAVLTQLLEKAEAANVDKDQILYFLEQLSCNTSKFANATLRLCRAELLVSLDRKEDAASLLGESCYYDVKGTSLEPRAKDIVKKVVADSDKFRILEDLWLPRQAEPPKAIDMKATSLPSIMAAAKTIQAPVEKQSPLDALIHECSEAIDNEEIVAQTIAPALTTLSPADQAYLFTKLAELFEQNKALPQAEEYYKRAFRNSMQVDDLLNFYRRNNLIKKSSKILIKQLPKATGEARKEINLELAQNFNTMHDFENAAARLGDIIETADLERLDKVKYLRQQATYYMAAGKHDDAIQALKLASSESDIRQKEDIDIDTCLLMRITDINEAQKLYHSLTLRGAKSEKMQLLTIGFDIDAKKYDEASAMIDKLLATDNQVLKASLLEEKRRLQEELLKSQAEKEKANSQPS